jgi:hypothetical protein
MKEPTISAYMQCYSNQMALYQSLRAFRRSYPDVDVTLVSDCGEDFTAFGDAFALRYYRSAVKADPGNLGFEGAHEYLRRMHDHCLAIRSDFVILLEEDVTTLRRIRCFPVTDCAGPRFNAFAPRLNQHLQTLNGTTADYGYAMCGGSIFRRDVFVECYERRNLDLQFLATLDEAILQYGDVLLTTLFLINGFTFSVWEEVSESRHPVEDIRIFRDAAFDHADKRWYGAEFDAALLARMHGGPA